MQRLEGQGLRVMAAAYRDIDHGTFNPDGDLVAYVSDIELTSLVGR